MNAIASIAVSVLAASAAAVGVSVALQPDAVAAPSPEIGELRASLDALRDEHAQLHKRLDAVATRPAGGSRPSVERTEVPTISDERIAAAVAAYLQKRGTAPSDAALAGGGDAPFDLDAAVEELDGQSYWENTAAWKRAFEAGKMDEVIAELEAAANANPNDIQAQMSLANAYMAYMQMDQTKWQMSMKADEQYDKVLAIDSTHWEARFTKAMSYTFWPDFLGKKKEAIGHFETLIEQQESLPVQDHHAQTYLFLGNMLIERDPERAQKVWQQGLQRHPTNAELLERLGQ